MLDHPSLDGVSGETEQLGSVDDVACFCEGGLDDQSLGGDEVQIIEYKTHQTVRRG